MKSIALGRDVRPVAGCGCGLKGVTLSSSRTRRARKSAARYCVVIGKGKGRKVACFTKKSSANKRLRGYRRAHPGARARVKKA